MSAASRKAAAQVAGQTQSPWSGWRGAGSGAFLPAVLPQMLPAVFAAIPRSACAAGAANDINSIAQAARMANAIRQPETRCLSKLLMQSPMPPLAVPVNVANQTGAAVAIALP